ncbi:hypothetical protein ACFOZ0_20480 [Streptomyces yaanensis]|uniref:CSD domain-containing protein n=1 Tax=Streptomyces yaanensis TaxID=1142239 RepID=A0ABV7SHG1_9ACTN|nr:hypothetical protein [Streptomyces sp. CGMCC 4.7035]WNB97776.1 hypothetical protein Q2K21_06620 [Streptomyces sp. CGMCC 4.7035]
MSGPCHGTIVDRRTSGGGVTGALGSYVVQDDEDERYYSFDCRQIMTEGFRTIRTGERVCFHVSAQSPDRAEFVIHLDQPDPAEYYL